VVRDAFIALTLLSYAVVNPVGLLCELQIGDAFRLDDDLLQITTTITDTHTPVATTDHIK